MATTELRGRERELDVLSRRVSDVAAGQGGIVVVEGAAGIGKSRLMSEVVARARDAGVTVAAGGADELDGMAPLAPLLTALRRADPPILGLQDLEALLTGSDGQYLILEHLRAVLEDRSHVRPIMIALDDLQWADPVTLLAVRALAPPLAASPVMWLLARNSTRPSPALESLVSALTSAGAEVISLEPLSKGALAELTADVLGAPPDRQLMGLVEQSGGSPFQAVELLRTLGDEAVLTLAGGQAGLAPGGPPDRLYERVFGQLGPVSDGTRQMLEVGALFGRSFEVADVAAVMGRPAAQLLPLIQEALSAQILTDDGSQLRFHHDLIRQAAYRSIPTAARKALHQEAARARLSAGGSNIEAATHVSIGADIGDTAAIAMLERAATDVAIAAPGTAADLRLRALELTLRRDPRRSQRIVDAVRLLAAAGRVPEAESLAAEAGDDGLPPEMETQVRLHLAEALLVSGRVPRALEHVKAALALPRVPDRTAAMLRAVEAQANADAGEVDAARQAGDAAIMLGEASHHDAAVCKALMAMSAAEHVPGRLDRSLELIDRAVRVAAAGSREARALQPQWSFGRTLMMLDRFDEASTSFENARWEAERLGSTSTATLGHACRALMLFHLGRLDDAEAEAEAGLASAEQLETWTSVPEVLALLARVATCRGDLARAREYLRQGERFEGDSPDLLRRQLAWAAALLDAEENEPGRAVARLAPVFDASPDQLLSLGLDPTVGPQLVRLARDAGEPAAAAAAAAAAERLAALNPGVVSAVAAGLQARGLLDDDVDRLTAAADAFQSSPRPFGRARACEDAGEALAKAGLRDRTVGYLRQALSEYDTMGASFPAHRVRDRLHELGFPRPRGGPTTVQRPSFGWDSLTDAEVRIARLVAKGLTNRAIADRLFLSQHTVDSHLKHSFAKLGIRSRVQLTRLVLMREHKAEK